MTRQEFQQHLRVLGILPYTALMMAREASEGCIKEYENAEDAIFCFTIWDDTPQGFSFWDGVLEHHKHTNKWVIPGGVDRRNASATV